MEAYIKFKGITKEEWLALRDYTLKVFEEDYMLELETPNKMVTEEYEEEEGNLYMAYEDNTLIIHSVPLKEYLLTPETKEDIQSLDNKILIGLLIKLEG